MNILESKARERREARCWADLIDSETEIMILELNVCAEDEMAEHAWDDVKHVELSIGKVGKA